MKYAIWARVSGGYTGTREAWMREGGVVKTFDNLDEARAVAVDTERRMNSPYATADYSYKAMEYTS